MSNAWIFAFGTFAAFLCAVFVVVSARELSRAGRNADAAARAARDRARGE
jgi:hypothetical protein